MLLHSGVKLYPPERHIQVLTVSEWDLIWKSHLVFADITESKQVKIKPQGIRVGLNPVTDFFNIYFILFFNFTILYWFCHISTCICHRYTCVPHSEPSSLLPPHTIPLGRPSAPAPSIQYRASNLDW